MDALVAYRGKEEIFVRKSGLEILFLIFVSLRSHRIGILLGVEFTKNRFFDSKVEAGFFETLMLRKS